MLINESFSCIFIYHIMKLCSVLIVDFFYVMPLSIEALSISFFTYIATSPKWWVIIMELFVWDIIPDICYCIKKFFFWLKMLSGQFFFWYKPRLVLWGTSLGFWVAKVSIQGWFCWGNLEYIWTYVMARCLVATHRSDQISSQFLRKHDCRVGISYNSEN